MQDFLDIDLAHPVDWSAPLNRGLSAWYLHLPGYDAGKQLIDLCGRAQGLLTNMAFPSTLASGRNRSLRQGGYAQLNFDGTDDYVDCGTVPGLNGASKATLAVWMYRVDGAGSGSAGNYLQPQRFIITPFSDGNVYVGADDGTSAAYGFATYATTGWHHFVLVFDGTLTGDSNRLRLYIDGILQTLTFPAAAIPATLGTTTFRLGMDNTGAADRFYGGMPLDDIRCYAGIALSATLIQALSIQSRLGYPDELVRTRQTFRAQSSLTLLTGDEGGVVYFATAA